VTGAPCRGTASCPRSGGRRGLEQRDPWSSR
jgi:hypothetical protein